MELYSYIQNARKMLVFTGAGISTGSGIPDYRGPQGVWRRRQPVYYQDFMESEAARIEYWDQKGEDWEAFRGARPNAVHEAIAKLEVAGKVLSVVTQNIDGLHRLAGTSPERLVELHGTNSMVECQTCHWRDEPGAHFQSFRETRKPPVCACGGLLKPATISFGQAMNQEDMERAHEAAMKADLVVALGSTLSVHPAATIPVVAAQRGVPYVVINRGETGHDGMPFLTLRLEGDVGVIFPRAVEDALGIDD
jgi:NAD-dependent deacetylase